MTDAWTLRQQEQNHEHDEHESKEDDLTINGLIRSKLFMFMTKSLGFALLL